MDYITNADKANIHNTTALDNPELLAPSPIPSVNAYIQNPDKTENNRLVTGYECFPELADEQFATAQELYAINTGREQKVNSRLLYHIRQSFAPGEVDPIVANRIGRELALEFTGGNHQFVVATHTDRAHIHNHILVNAVNLDCNGKFKDPLYSGRRDVARISDKICKEYGLSVIEHKQGWREPYNEWEQKHGITKADKPMSKRGRLEEIIGFCLDKQPRDFEQLLKYLEDYSCYAKQRGQNISITTPFAKKPIRLSSLSDDFTEERLREQISARIRARIENEQNKKWQAKLLPVDSKPKEVRLIIDIHRSLKATESIGYRKWAEKFNLKQMSQTLIFIERHKLTLGELEAMATNKHQTLANIKYEIENKDAQLQHISLLQRYIGAYDKTKDVYKRYRQSANSEKFIAENAKALLDYETAVDYFRKCGYGFDSDNTLPTISELKQDYAKHDAAKKSLWAKYHEIRNGDKEIENAWGNVRAILNLDNDTEFVSRQFEMTWEDLEQYENEISEPQNEFHQPQKSFEVTREIVPAKIEPKISPQPQQNIQAPKPKIKKRSGPSL